MVRSTITFVKHNKQPLQTVTCFPVVNCVELQTWFYTSLCCNVSSIQEDQTSAYWCSLLQSSVIRFQSCLNWIERTRYCHIEHLSALTALNLALRASSRIIRVWCWPSPLVGPRKTWFISTFRNWRAICFLRRASNQKRMNYAGRHLATPNRSFYTNCKYYIIVIGIQILLTDLGSPCLAIVTLRLKTGVSLMNTQKTLHWWLNFPSHFSDVVNWLLLNRDCCCFLLLFTIVLTLQPPAVIYLSRRVRWAHRGQTLDIQLSKRQSLYEEFFHDEVWAAIAQVWIWSHRKAELAIVDELYLQ